jgi:hypothetical protein
MALWLSAPDGSNAIRLVSAPGAGSPKWAPDGKSIVFDSLASGRRQLYVVSTNGGAPVSITSGDSENESGSWSNDGQWIYFASNRAGQWQIWKTPLQNGSAPVQVTANGGGYAQESPDGKYLYYQQRLDELDPLPQIWRIPASGGKEEPVIDCSTWFWEVRKDGIYFIDNQPAPVIKRFRFGSRHVQTMATLKAAAWGGPGLSLSTDEQTAYYTQIDSSGSDVMLIKNFYLP